MGESFQLSAFNNVWSPVQTVLNIDEMTSLNGGLPAPPLPRGSPLPLEKPTVFACSLGF